MGGCILASLRHTLAAAVCALGTLSAEAGTTANFDDLASPPALDSGTGLEFANGGSLVYAGAVWDSHFTVVGDEYRVDPLAGPLFGLPHSPHYFVTNGDGVNGLVISTAQVLKGAWFGRNEYYGFGGGADQVTVVALAGELELVSVTAELADATDGQPEPLMFVDTSIFAGYTGITGYRIDRHATGEFNGNWVADDFVFAAPVPLPGTLGLLAGGLALVGARRRGRR